MMYVSGFLAECFIKEVGRKIAARSGCDEEVQIREKIEDEGVLSFGSKEIINVARPLWRVMKIITPTHEEVWGTVRYERLPFICFVKTCHTA